ncbi:MAG: response regulator transcription factor [Chromatiales bacterium]|nr:response regulator transcription factor [Chromatiales bacterium]
MVKILIVDDHDIVRDGLKMLIAEHDDLEVAGEADNGLSALSMVRETDWDIILMDLSMPGKSGIDLVKQIKAEKSDIPLLILSMHKEEQYAVRAIQAGASGYLCKSDASTSLIKAIRKVTSGGLFITPAVAEQMAMGIMPAQTTLPHTLLSNREFQVFQQIVEGSNLTKIAENLNLSVKTISTHKTRIMQKMELNNVTDMIRYAIKHEMLDDIPDGVN